MMKSTKLLFFSIIVLGCNINSQFTDLIKEQIEIDKGTAKIYTINLHGNGNDSGQPPIISDKFALGDIVILPDNSKGLVKDQSMFTGWNSHSDGSGMYYSSESEIMIDPDIFDPDNRNLDLYADWTELWVKSYGSLSGNDVAVDILEGSDGNPIVFGHTNAGSSGGSDLFLFKIDGESGDYIWQKCYGSSLDESAVSAELITDGNILLCANADTLINGYEVLFLCVNDKGEILWQKTHGSTGDDKAYDMSVSSVGDIFICGTANNSISGVMDRMWAKFKSNGDLIWDYTKDYRDGNESFTNIVVQQDGSFILSGIGRQGYYFSSGDESYSTYTYSTADFDYTYDPNDECIYKLSTGTPFFHRMVSFTKDPLNGSAGWSIYFDTLGEDICSDYVKDESGDFLIGGYSDSTDSGDTDLYLLSVTAEGEKEVHQSYNAPGDQFMVGMMLSNQGSLFVCGNDNRNSNNDILIIKTEEYQPFFNSELNDLNEYTGGGFSGVVDGNHTIVDQDYSMISSSSSYSASSNSFISVTLE